MNGYLVLIRGLCTEFPIALCTSRCEAAEIAKKAASHPRQAIAGLEINMGEPTDEINCVAVIQFKDGRPVCWDRYSDDSRPDE
jgi:hypothetical protein